MEQLWEDKHSLQGFSPALGRGRRCECGAAAPEGPAGDLPTHRMLKQKPCDVDLLTSWSGRLSKPTWPDRDRFLRSSFCKSQEKSRKAFSRVATPLAGNRSCQNWIKDTEAFGTQDLCRCPSQTHSPFSSIHLCCGVQELKHPQTNHHHTGSPCLSPINHDSLP